MLKRYTATTDFDHSGRSYKPGQTVDMHDVTGDALKQAGLLIDYIAPDPQPPVRELSASRPGRASRKQTSKPSDSNTQQG